MYAGLTLFDVKELSLLNVDQTYGIEIEEFPARIAEVAMWLVDHQMNVKLSEELGHYYVRLPLRKSANIVNGNALRIDWEEIVPKNELSYILGNPPFVGSKMLTESQRSDLKFVLNTIHGSGVLDFVSGWYVKSANYIQDTNITVAFVSTNSISQGEQVGILWKEMFEKYNIKIHFAHRTFQWNSEARGKAAVHVVIIGFADFDIENKRIFEYEDIKGEPHEVKARNINPYLIEGKDITITSKSNPISKVPKMSFVNMPLDGGNLLLTEEEKIFFENNEPLSVNYIKELVSAFEFLNGKKRYCFWLVDIDPSILKQLPLLMEKVKKVKEFRLASVAESTRKFADFPTLFRDRNNPDSFVLIPRVSSEIRKYIPIGMFDNSYIPSDTCMQIPNAQIYHFGVLTSEMHMAWVRYTCGRLESRFRYSKDIVYNNFPWPEDISDAQKKLVEEKAR